MNVAFFVHLKKNTSNEEFKSRFFFQPIESSYFFSSFFDISFSSSKSMEESNYLLSRNPFLFFYKQQNVNSRTNRHCWHRSTSARCRRSRRVMDSIGAKERCHQRDPKRKILQRVLVLRHKNKRELCMSLLPATNPVDLPQRFVRR